MESTTDGFGQSYTQNGQEFTYLDEGWVWVTPYWNPTTPIKVCAFDAEPILSAILVWIAVQETPIKIQVWLWSQPRMVHDSTVQTVYKEAFAEELSVRKA